MSDGTALAEHYAYCESQVKAADHTAWLAGLFAPADTRPSIYALQAFALDVDSVRGKVREPLAGELRLQWWTDAIEGETRGDVQGHPIAAAVLDTIRRCHVSRPALTGYLDAKRIDLYDDPIPTLLAYDERADQIGGALIAAQAQILKAPLTPTLSEACRQAGRATAVLRSLQSLASPTSPLHVTFPLDVLSGQGAGVAELQVRRPTPHVRAALAEFGAHGLRAVAALRASRADLDPLAGPAFLLASLAAPTIKAVLKASDPFAARVDLAQWRKQWLMWRASRRNGVL